METQTQTTPSTPAPAAAPAAPVKTKKSFSIKLLGPKGWLYFEAYVVAYHTKAKGWIVETYLYKTAYVKGVERLSTRGATLTGFLSLTEAVLKVKAVANKMVEGGWIRPEPSKLPGAERRPDAFTIDDIPAPAAAPIRSKK